MRNLFRPIKVFFTPFVHDAELTILTFSLLFFVSGGTLFYHIQEGCSWLDSFYFCTMTMTTVGYGDFSPTTDISKLFTIVYAVSSIGLFIAFASKIAGIHIRETLRHKRRK
ncbi:MAG: two pore domain potassium channel family protein [Bacteroidetes bacterium]|nr:two pore domain potassium channel family protein [Bacteroidota bacterium]